MTYILTPMSPARTIELIKETIENNSNDLGLGTLAKQNSNSVSITGGAISNITDLAVADGGTGASDPINARANLSAAKSGSNSDITSLTGLTTALSIAQGGTGGITAPAARTALGITANATVAYASAAWTPDLKFGGGNTGITYTTKTGAYTRIGRIVNVTCYLVLSSIGALTGAITITGLPFAANANGGGLYANFYANLASLSNAPIGFIGAGGNSIALYQAGAAATTALTNANLTNTTIILLTGSYDIGVDT